MVSCGLEQQEAAVNSGYWPLYRYNPAATDKNLFSLDSKQPTIPLRNYAYNETRYKMLTKTHPEIAKKLIEEAQVDVNEKWQYYADLGKNEKSEK